MKGWQNIHIYKAPVCNLEDIKSYHAYFRENFNGIMKIMKKMKKIVLILIFLISCKREGYEKDKIYLKYFIDMESKKIDFEYYNNTRDESIITYS